MNATRKSLHREKESDYEQEEEKDVVVTLGGCGAQGGIFQQGNRRVRKSRDTLGTRREISKDFSSSPPGTTRIPVFTLRENLLCLQPAKKRLLFAPRKCERSAAAAAKESLVVRPGGYHRRPSPRKWVPLTTARVQMGYCSPSPRATFVLVVHCNGERCRSIHFPLELARSLTGLAVAWRPRRGRGLLWSMCKGEWGAG